MASNQEVYDGDHDVLLFKNRQGQEKHLQVSLLEEDEAH